MNGGGKVSVGGRRRKEGWGINAKPKEKGDVCVCINEMRNLRDFCLD